MNKILILDFGSQFTQLIARRIRELGYYSFILPGTSALERIENFAPNAVILSGGPSSVYETGSPQLAEGFWNWAEKNKMPTLGVCYGMQLMVQQFGGKIRSASHKEYGRMGVQIEAKHPLFEGVTAFQAWMSHGDETENLPSGFVLVGKSAAGAVASMAHTTLPYVGIQFHPEVAHTERGTDILRNFISGMAKLTANWKIDDIITSQIKNRSRSSG